MALKRIDKQKEVLRKYLSEMGWHYANTTGTGLCMIKNNFYLWVEPDKIEIQPIQDAKGSEYLGVPVNFQSRDCTWYVTNDGLILDSGKLPISLAKTYDFGKDSDGWDKTSEFLTRIDNYSSMSKNVSLLCKSKEVVFTSGSSEQVAVYSNKSIPETKLFSTPKRVDLQDGASILPKVLYEVVGADSGNFAVAQKSEDFIGVDEKTKVTIPFDTFVSLAQQGALISMEIAQRVNTSKAVTLEKLCSEDTTVNLTDIFEDFNLSSGQRTLVASALAQGFNPTPLLDSRYSIDELQKIYNIVVSGVNTKAMVNKKLPSETLTLLEDIASKELPIEMFCKESANPVMLRRQYEGISETVVKKLQEQGSTSAAYQLIATRAAFEKRSIETLEDSGKLLSIQLSYLAQGGDHLANLILQRGIIENQLAYVSWMSLSEDDRDKILLRFKCENMTIHGVDWNFYLENNRGQISNLLFDSQLGYLLEFCSVQVGCDYNSACMFDSMRNVLWRSLYVNEKFYTYEDNSLASFL